MPDAQALERSRHCVSLFPVKVGLAYADDETWREGS